MPRAIWNGTVIAESDETQVIDGNHYFPPESLRREFFEESDTTTHCPWKGDASYCHVTVNGETARDAAWYYPSTKEQAKSFEGHYAFWNGVEVEG